MTDPDPIYQHHVLSQTTIDATTAVLRNTSMNCRTCKRTLSYLDTGLGHEPQGIMCPAGCTTLLAPGLTVLGSIYRCPECLSQLDLVTCDTKGLTLVYRCTNCAKLFARASHPQAVKHG